MKRLLFLQRILASVIDLLVIYFPSQFLAFILFRESSSAQIWLPVFLFILYNLLVTAHFSGQTLGKYFAGLKVASPSSSMMEMGQREAVKILYFLPLAGLLFMLISLIIYLKEGRFLHDKMGQSEVIVSGRP